MSFWIAAAAMTGLTCLALLMALRRNADVATDHDRRFYEAQIAEIERQQSVKLIGESEADAARTEAARRLLLASRDVFPPAETQGRARNLAAIVILVLVPAITLPIYLVRGTPDMPSFALAGRQRDVVPAGQPATMAAALQQIETHLARNPDDGRGHEVVAPVYMRLNRHDDAVRSFSAVIRILGPSGERHVNLGEAMVFQASGIVTADARASFERAVALEPKNIKARFFLALAAQQEGNREKAHSLLSELRDDLPEGELKNEISQQLAELADAPKGADAIAALPADDQQAAIRSMVEGLAQRLAVSGGSADEWARLIRALTVLKEIDRARVILAEARQKFAAEPEQLQRIEEAGKALP